MYKKVYTKTDNELNDLSYKDALKYDKRTYFTFYCSLVKSNHLLFFHFFQFLILIQELLKYIYSFLILQLFSLLMHYFLLMKQWVK